MKRKPRYAQITAHPDTEAERERIDNAARAADERWEQERKAAGRMTLEDARALAESEGRKWAFRQEHACGRSKTRRATKIRVSCQIWTKVGTYTIPGLGTGGSLADGVYAGTWEEAVRLARLRVKVRELDRRAEEQALERARELERRKWNRRHGVRT